MFKREEYFRDVCDNTIKIRSKRKYIQSLTHNKFNKCIRRKHAFENTNFFDIDPILNEYFTNHNKKCDIYLVKYDFKLF